MRFWDASAVVALCVEEETTQAVRDMVASDSAMAVWWATPVEAASAFARLRRMGGIEVAEEQAARDLIAEYRGIWTEMQPSAALRERAMRLLSVHELRAADSLQLAAAVGWAGDAREGQEFVCLDGRLSEAARREGFRVLPADGPGTAGSEQVRE